MSELKTRKKQSLKQKALASVKESMEAMAKEWAAVKERRAYRAHVRRELAIWRATRKPTTPLEHTVYHRAEAKRAMRAQKRRANHIAQSTAEFKRWQHAVDAQIRLNERLGRQSGPELNRGFREEWGCL